MDTDKTLILRCKTESKDKLVIYSNNTGVEFKIKYFGKTATSIMIHDKDINAIIVALQTYNINRLLRK